jgi:hypothetical protein
MGRNRAIYARLGEIMQIEKIDNDSVKVTEEITIAPRTDVKIYSRDRLTNDISYHQSQLIKLQNILAELNKE